MNVGLRVALVVLRALFVLQHFLQMLVRVAANVAHGDLGRLGFLVHDFGQLLAALLGQRRHRHANQFARRCGIEPEVRIANRLFHHRDHFLLERLHTDRSRIGQRHVRDLVDRHHRAVIVDVDMVEQTGMRAAGAHLGQVVLQRLHRFLHFLLSGFLDVADHRSSSN